MTRILTRSRLPCALRRAALAILPSTLIGLVAVSLLAGQEAGRREPGRRQPSPRRSSAAQKDKTRRDFGADCLSAGCHAQLHDRPMVHGPVAVGACDICHVIDGLEKDHKFKPARPKEEFCTFCHRFEEAQTSVHQAVIDGDCVSCHDPHGGDVRTLLLATDARSLCVKCHEPKKSAQSLRGFAFEDMHASDPDARCLDCHRPHQSRFAHLLVGKENLACLGCHDRDLPRPGRDAIHNIKAQIETAKFTHAPISSGQCSVCHGSHSSETPHLLTASYSSGFYTAFSEDAYALCFSCHGSELATAEKTTATNFRDGTRNLHFVHVNQSKGRGCRICHDPHATEEPALLRKSVAFGPGGWNLPIGFQRTPTGGSCSSGCHKKIRYDNSQPPGEVKVQPPGGVKAPLPTGAQE